MIKFLVDRPIAVSMIFLSLVTLGTIAIHYIPVTLLPDMDIPQATVQVYGENFSARQMEDRIIHPLRRELAQTTHLEDIRSETRDENGIIHLRFSYGTDIDFAFIEVNEKIDKAMNTFPGEIERPKTIKASATDIPAFYLNLTTAGSGTEGVSARFKELSNFATQVIRKRIEQLPEVSLVDMSGRVHSEIVVIPDKEKLQAMNISISELEQFIRSNNVKIGNLLIRDGQYEYNVWIDSEVKDIKDLENLFFNKEGTLITLSELATITPRVEDRKGLVSINGKNAISMAVIKQGDVQMREFKEKLRELTIQLQEDYPDIKFEISRDQTQLLEFAINNLSQSLAWGIVLAFLVMFFFLKDFRSPLLIGINVPVSLLITVLVFHLLDLSINIISLSGLILGVGMMVDNSIIVIDNIAQYKERERSLVSACVNGASEVFRPMLSAVLTTCAVFIPLIFLGGIAGALFYDQAMAITIGLFISLLVSMTLLPVYYRLFYGAKGKSWLDTKLQQLNTVSYGAFYEKGFHLVMRNQITCWVMFGLFFTGTILLFQYMPKSRLAEMQRDDFLLHVDWNESIHVDENHQRLQHILSLQESGIDQSICHVGRQEYLLNNIDLSASEAVVYIKGPGIDSIPGKIQDFLIDNYANARYSFAQANNIFDIIFSSEQPPLTLELQKQSPSTAQYTRELASVVSDLKKQFPGHDLAPVSFQEYVKLTLDPVKLKLYNISLGQITSLLQQAFNEKDILIITSGQESIPVILGDNVKKVSEIINTSLLTNQGGITYPLRELITQAGGQDLKIITADQEGEYYPVDFYKAREGQATEIIREARMLLAGNDHFRIDFSGDIFKSQQLINELAVILAVSLLLLYFILAAQFESVIIPFIILLEVPVAIFGALASLKLCGYGIDLMAMIGIIVMCGIIINDSILKIDTINQLIRKGAMSLIRAMLVAGQRRLKPILMTSITTILAMAPMLFLPGLGADLQKPLALAVIGGMTVGTLVSLYFIPLCYFQFAKPAGR